MAKLSVYIPDAMKADIEKWRGEMDFSQLFRDAFGRAVRKAKNPERRAVYARMACPMLRDWTCEFTLLIEAALPDAFDGSVYVAQEMFTRAGKYGIGHNRPAKGGPNGQFVVEEFLVSDVLKK